MKTEYQARGHGIICRWISDAAWVRENLRSDDATLWRRQSETPEEKAVRRMFALEQWEANGCPVCRPLGERLNAFADRLCPPPPTTEVQVGWDSLEPVEEISVWESFDGTLWIAGKSKEQWFASDPERNFESLLGEFGTPPTVAIGISRQDALDNLAKFKARK